MPTSFAQPLQHEINSSSHHELVIVEPCETSNIGCQSSKKLQTSWKITDKLCLFMHLIHIRKAPRYLSDSVSTVSAASGRYGLRSTGSVVYVLPRTKTRFGEHAFFSSNPAAWNTPPSDLHKITDTSTCRKRLKSVIFDGATVASAGPYASHFHFAPDI